MGGCSVSARQEYGFFQLGWSQLGAPAFPLSPVHLSDGIISATGRSGSVQASVARSGVVLASVQRNGVTTYLPATEDGILEGSI